MTYQIAYTSAAARDMSDKDIEDILAAARRNNPREGLTGQLTYADGSFLQVLEGDKDAVERRYATIKADPRHRFIQRLVGHDVPGRSFGDWSMGWYKCPPDSPLRGLVKQISSKRDMEDAAVHHTKEVETLMNIFIKHRFT